MLCLTKGAGAGRSSSTEKNAGCTRLSALLASSFCLSSRVRFLLTRDQARPIASKTAPIELTVPMTGALTPDEDDEGVVSVVVALEDPMVLDSSELMVVVTTA